MGLKQGNTTPSERMVDASVGWSNSVGMCIILVFYNLLTSILSGVRCGTSDSAAVYISIIPLTLDQSQLSALRFLHFHQNQYTITHHQIEQVPTYHSIQIIFKTIIFFSITQVMYHEAWHIIHQRTVSVIPWASFFVE